MLSISFTYVQSSPATKSECTYQQGFARSDLSFSVGETGCHVSRSRLLKPLSDLRCPGTIATAKRSYQEEISLIYSSHSSSQSSSSYFLPPRPFRPPCQTASPSKQLPIWPTNSHRENFPQTPMSSSTAIPASK